MINYKQSTSFAGIVTIIKPIWIEGVVGEYGWMVVAICKLYH